MSNTTTHLTPDDILTRDDLAELAIWESAQFNRSLIDNNNHTTKKKSAKSSFSNDVPRNISTNQKILLPKPLQEAPTSISSNNNNSHGHGDDTIPLGNEVL
ncbi:22578_t:CDS:2 [Entrophospora sp. SA101]|nr:22578_t:CDS:2 [Entrophospora sp. SA101]